MNPPPPPLSAPVQLIFTVPAPPPPPPVLRLRLCFRCQTTVELQQKRDEKKRTSWQSFTPFFFISPVLDPRPPCPAEGGGRSLPIESDVKTKQKEKHLWTFESFLLCSSEVKCYYRTPPGAPRSCDRDVGGLCFCVVADVDLSSWTESCDPAA